jgi:hypothetical protein
VELCAQAEDDAVRTDQLICRTKCSYLSTRGCEDYETGRRESRRGERRCGRNGRKKKPEGDHEVPSLHIHAGDTSTEFLAFLFHPSSPTFRWKRGCIAIRTGFHTWKCHAARSISHVSFSCRQNNNDNNNSISLSFLTRPARTGNSGGENTPHHTEIHIHSSLSY